MHPRILDLFILAIIILHRTHRMQWEHPSSRHKALTPGDAQHVCREAGRAVSRAAKEWAAREVLGGEVAEAQGKQHGL